MIISENCRPPYLHFCTLMERTDVLLNAEARKSSAYFRSRTWQELEEDVFNAMVFCARDTDFDGNIKLISGARFPDIVVSDCYGVEVKSARSNDWTSTGGSILESTRHPNVGCIYLTFCKISEPVEFLSKPYESCLVEIAVTHYPRYKIDMRIPEGETIFDKIGIPYDTLRAMDNPIQPISQYYSSLLREGEQLWWAPDAQEEKSIPPMVRTWSALPINLKDEYAACGLAYFPEIASEGNSSKYNRFSLWLITEKGIIHNNVRDTFSAGGRVKMRTSNEVLLTVPAVMGRISKHRDLIKNIIKEEQLSSLEKYWNINLVTQNPLTIWCHLIAKNVSSSANYETVLNLLKDLFFICD